MTKLLDILQEEYPDISTTALINIANICTDSFLDRLGTIKQFSFSLSEDIVTLDKIQKEFKS